MTENLIRVPLEYVRTLVSAVKDFLASNLEIAKQLQERLSVKNGKFIIPIVIPPKVPYYKVLKTNSKYFAYFTLGLKGVLEGCYANIFEYGEVYGGNWKILFHNFKSFTRKLGQWQDLIKIRQKI